MDLIGFDAIAYESMKRRLVNLVLSSFPNLVKRNKGVRKHQ